MTKLFNTFKCINSSNIHSNRLLSDILKDIKYGYNRTSDIIKLRDIGKGNYNYDKLKSTIPTVRFNFNFKEKATNNNIIKSTGYIYIDVDDYCIDLDNDYIFASWKSVSNNGYSILVKVDGLTIDNFKDVYNYISNDILNLPTDNGARKPTQQTVISYDPNLYLNTNSKIVNIKELNILNDLKEIKKGDIYHIKKEEETYTLNVPFLENIFSSEDIDKSLNNIFNSKDIKEDKLKLNGIGDYFNGEYKNVPYIIFNEKEKICIPFLPKKIYPGSRNKIMYFILSQMALMNKKNISEKTLKTLANDINDRFVEKYDKNKINSIIKSILTQLKENKLEEYKNSERRIIFNPNINISKEEKQKIVGKELGRVKTDKTKGEIEDCLSLWDFSIDGKITQKKVSEKINKNERTIKRYWTDEIKESVIELNRLYKNK